MQGVRLLILAGAVGATLSACAPTPPPPAQPASGLARQCFEADLVSGFTVVDERTVDLDVGDRQFRANLFGSCPYARSAISVGVRSQRGSSVVCEGAPLDLIVPGPREPRSCPVASLRLRTPEERAASPSPRR